MVHRRETHSDEILSLLGELGLSDNEALVYRYLVEKGGATTKELLRYLNLRQPQVYDIMSALSRKNFINVQESRPKRYIPVNLELLTQQKVNALLQGREKLIKWYSQIKHKSDEPSMWMDRNWEGFLNNARDIILHSASDICIESNHEIFSTFTSELLKKKQEGVRILYLVFGEEERRYAERHLASDSRCCGEIRYHDPGQFFAVISDGKASAFMPRTGAFRSERQRYGYIFKDNDMAWFHAHNFFYAWYRAKMLYSEEIKLPALYLSHRIAVSDMLRLRDRGKADISVSVTGRSIADNSDITLDGRVVDITVDHDIVNFSVFARGERYSIGGYDTIVEDIEAKSIEILRAE